MIASTAAWVVKTCFGVANLIVFGATARNGPGYEYQQGFWCAILSVCLSGATGILLVAHLFVRFGTNHEQLRFEGRTFILSELTLFGTLAIEALIFSQLEGWSFLDGVYFSVVTVLTIGFGDLSPTRPATKVLLFPFAIVGFALLSNQLSLIVSVVGQRTKARRRQWYLNSVMAYQQYSEQHDLLKPKLSVDKKSPSDANALKAEIARLHRMAEARQSVEDILDLTYSGLALVVFWVIGAVIFHYMEGWGFGDSFYFNYVFFITIGFGDFSPQTPVGRSVFVIWALIAVPIMTNFVVTTISTVVERTSKWLAESSREKKNERKDIAETYYVSHDEYLITEMEGEDALYLNLGPSALHGQKRGGKAAPVGGDADIVNEGDQGENAPQWDLEKGERPGGGDGNHCGVTRRNPSSRSRTGSRTGSRPGSRADHSPSAGGEGGGGGGGGDPEKPKLGNADYDVDIDGGDGGGGEDEEMLERIAATSALPSTKEEQEASLRHALSLATFLEAQARSILIEQLTVGSPERLLLQADINVQNARLAEWGHDPPPWTQSLRSSLQEDSTLERIKKYRMTYARLLVAGRKALQLEGDVGSAFERRGFGKITQSSWASSSEGEGEGAGQGEDEGGSGEDGSSATEGDGQGQGATTERER